MPFLTAYGAMVAVGGVRAGAAEVVVSDEEDVPARLLDLTGGRGAEFVFDAVAGPGVAAPARAVAPDGTVFLWGAQSGQPTPCPGFDLGMPALNLRTYTMLEVTGDPRRMFRATAFITSGLRTGSLSAVVDRVFPLTEIVEAHRSMEANEQFGEIVVSTMA
ncbi:zinc-binding dehydrogenase [Streptomyces sp. NPDC050560]|uniref:zinc-binding dehydrogenase n=1 Tax=Streptomyces sp. NPDC050560 TaxID=3365630 RepID=UPI0037AACF2D